MKRNYCIALILLLVAVLPVQAGTGNQLVSLGTAGLTGVYYPTGGAICRLVNQQRQQHGIRCSIEATPGSVDNIDRIRRGDLDLGIAESGWLYRAWSGSGRFQEQGPAHNLRTLVRLFPEFLTVLARREAGITHFQDIRDKRISIGKPGTSQRATMNALMKGNGWRLQDFAMALSLPATEQPEALCDGRIDVMVYTVGHPSGATKEVARECGGRLIPIEGGAARQLTEGNPHYRQMVIPAGTYRDNPDDVTTVGVNAMFFADASLPEDVAYAVVKSLFEQLDQFRQMHPAFASLQPELMVKGPYPAPLHPGAERYFREVGLL